MITSPRPGIAVQRDSCGTVVRLYQLISDSPNELSIQLDGDTLHLLIEDRDSGNDQLEIAVPLNNLCYGIQVLQ